MTAPASILASQPAQRLLAGDAKGAAVSGFEALLALLGGQGTVASGGMGEAGEAGASKAGAGDAGKTGADDGTSGEAGMAAWLAGLAGDNNWLAQAMGQAPQDGAEDGTDGEAPITCGLPGAKTPLIADVAMVSGEEAGKTAKGDGPPSVISAGQDGDILDQLAGGAAKQAQAAASAKADGVQGDATQANAAQANTAQANTVQADKAQVQQVQAQAQQTQLDAGLLQAALARASAGQAATDQTAAATPAVATPASEIKAARKGEAADGQAAELKAARLGKAAGPAGAQKTAEAPVDQAKDHIAEVQAGEVDAAPVEEAAVAEAVPAPAEAPDHAGPTVQTVAGRLESAAAGLTALAAAVRGAPETVAKMAAGIIEKLGGQTTRFDLQLEPNGLGKVDVSVEIGRDGKLNAALSFDSAQAASDLKGRSQELRTALEQAGFSIGDGGLSFDFTGQSQNQGDRPQPQSAGQASRAFAQTLNAADTPPADPIRFQARRGLDILI
jgi:flagellar hook-length control protein FliK